MEFLGRLRDDLHGWDADLYVTRLESLDQWRTLHQDGLWRAVVEDSGAGFALFLAGDWTDVRDEFYGFAAYCLGNGIFWLSVWGPDCERMCDLFAEEEVGDGSAAEPTVVMTTWHAGEPLHEAMTLFFMAFPDEGRLAGPARIAISVGERDWTSSLSEIARRELPA